MTSAAGKGSSWTRLSDIFKRVVELWALAGGVLLLVVVLIVAYSVAAGLFFHKPLAGDFEVVQIGVAIAVFAFLPYCQLTDANVTADIFTAGAGPRTLVVLKILASLIALFVSVVLLWRSWYGMLDYRQHLEQTMVFQFPLWIAFIPMLISFLLLIGASIISLHEARHTQPGTSNIDLGAH